MASESISYFKDLDIHCIDAWIGIVLKAAVGFLNLPNFPSLFQLFCLVTAGLRI